ncbi:LacI family DNA-binding transcriptional regulator [Oerskovia sp. M15]
MTPRPTLLDVAAHAGVSKSLVSLALRGDPGVSERTRERIRLAADALGYRSNVLARSLKQGRTLLIGAVISSLDNPYHTEIVAGSRTPRRRQGSRCSSSTARATAVTSPVTSTPSWGSTSRASS